MAGADAALASERGYVARTLPAGIVRHLGAVLRGDPWGVARAAAIVAGALITVAGYAVDLVSQRLAGRALRSDPRTND
jgi:hypothetical protein